MTILEIILIVIIICLIAYIIYRLRKVSGLEKKIKDLQTELARPLMKYEKPKEIKKPRRKPKEKPWKRPKLRKKKITIKDHKKIVMIEDDPFITKIFEDKFEEAGFEITIFNSGSEELVEEIAKEKPNIISMDIILPGINGIEMTKLLKRDKRTRDIPIIALGILEEKEMIRDAIDAGIEDYYVKADQRPSEYVRAIDSYLKDPRNYRENYTKLIKK